MRLGEWPARRAAISPDRSALIFGDEVTTYAEFHRRVEGSAGRLHSLGVRAGDRVAYLGPNHPLFVELMFAAYRVGAVFVPLNARLAAPEVDYLLAHSGAAVLVYDPECYAGTPPIDVAIPLSGWAADASGYTAVENDMACILYTSGTTGRPKGVQLTHDNVLWNCFNVLVGMDVAGDEVTLVSAPLFHVAALNQCLLPTFLKGGCSVIMPSWDVDGCFDLIVRHRITWMFGVATMFAALARSPRWAGADLSSVRHLIVGGSSVPPALTRAYQARGLTFCQGYGLTETAPGATFLEAPEAARHVGSAGPPVFFADVRLDAAGEVLIRGPNVTPGYYRDPEATSAAFTGDGWFRSGDVARVDEHGHFHIVDRVKDMYVSGGENVYPAEVEAVLFEHPGVAEVAVVGVPDETWGEVGRAFVVPAPGCRPTVADLRSFLDGRLARYKFPAYAELVDALPRTGSNKVRKSELRARPMR